MNYTSIMARLALAALLAAGCTASTAVGVSTATAVALGASALQRQAGGCYATCTGGTYCNPRNGLCEKLPCEGRCGPDQHCESTAFESVCAPGPASDVTAKAPGKTPTIPVMPPMQPVEGGPPQIVPAAEQNPPSH